MSGRPEWGTEDYRRYAVLFNDITHAETSGHLLFSDRQRLCDHLWAQGWRRDVRAEDVTEGCTAQDPNGEGPCRVSGEHDWHDNGRGTRWTYHAANRPA